MREVSYNSKVMNTRKQRYFHAATAVAETHAIITKIGKVNELKSFSNRPTVERFLKVIRYNNIKVPI